MPEILLALDFPSVSGLSAFTLELWNNFSVNKKYWAFFQFLLTHLFLFQSLHIFYPACLKQLLIKTFKVKNSNSRWQPLYQDTSVFK